MNWNYWLPWREYPEGDKDSSNLAQVIEGDGPKRVVVSEGKRDDELEYSFEE